MHDFERFTKFTPPQRRSRAWWRLPFAMVVICLAFFFGGSMFPAADVLDDPEELSGKRDVPAMNILAVGTDERPEGEESEAMGVRADAIMVVRVLPKSGEVRILSIPRDLFIEISPGTSDRVNASYASGGIEQTIRAVEGYTGIEIHNHAVVDFDGFEDVITAVGGVEVDIPEGENPPSLEAGKQTLDGEEALEYARHRGTSGGDLDRMERQREILSALRKQALEPGSVANMPEISRVAGENISTDIGVEESISLGRTMLGRGDAPLETGQLAGEPSTLEDGREVLIPDEEANRRVIEEFLEKP